MTVDEVNAVVESTNVLVRKANETKASGDFHRAADAYLVMADAWEEFGLTAKAMEARAMAYRARCRTGL